MHKILLLSGATLVLGASSVSAYLQAQPKEQLSNLTLANIEALGGMHDEIGNIASCPWPAERYATCTEITMYPDGKVVSVLIYGRGATYDPNVRP